MKNEWRRLSWKGDKRRVFCLSMQRSGTTSVGDFFKHFKYPTSGYSTKRSSYWSKLWFQGDFESIFRSSEFLSYQVFEDNPWWYPEFYKVLYHRFPDAKFILLTRDQNDWFDSMKKHSKGKTLGNTEIHCKIYRRESDYKNLTKQNDHQQNSTAFIDNLLELEGHRAHYTAIYENRNREIIDFFNKNRPESLFHRSLYDAQKWPDLGNFIGIRVPTDFNVHSNKS